MKDDTSDKRVESGARLKEIRLGRNQIIILKDTLYVNYFITGRNLESIYL